MFRGLSLYTTAEFAKTAADFTDLTKRNPKSADYPAWLALCNIGTGDLAGAGTAVGQSLAVTANNALGMTARSRLKLAQGDADGAKKDLVVAARRGPLTGVALETQQLIMLHEVFKPTDKPIGR